MILMLVLLVAVLAAFFGLKKYKKTHVETESTAETEYTITSMDASKADKLTVTVGGVAMNFSKKDDNWVYDDDPSVTLDQTKMSGIVSSLYNCSSTLKIVNPTDLDQYGLGDDAIQIELSSSDKTTSKITLGSFNQMISKSYIMKDGDKSVYAITGNDLTDLSGGIDSLTAAAETTTAVTSTTAESTSTSDVSTESETTATSTTSTTSITSTTSTAE